MSGILAMTSLAVSDRRRVAPSSCRCSDPIVRPSVSAERISSDSSSRDRSRLLPRRKHSFALGHSKLLLVGRLPLANVFSKLRAKRFRLASANARPRSATNAALYVMERGVSRASRN